MAVSLEKRLAALERRHKPSRFRFAWHDPDSGEPEPQAEPGETLIVFTWREAKKGRRRRGQCPADDSGQAAVS